MNKIVAHMYDGDLFSQWLGIRRLEEGEGVSKLEMTVRPEMVNGFGIAHGAIAFAQADSALAFASNSRGRKSVSVETSINHIKPVRVGDVITAIAKESSLAHKIALYDIEVLRGEELVALFKGMVYRKSEVWEV